MESQHKNPVLIDLLASFSEHEMDRFGNFITSTYFNRDQHVIRLLDFLKRKVWRKLTYNAKIQHRAFGSVFPDKETDGTGLDTAQKNLFNAKMALLNKLAKQFLCIEQLKENPACESELLYESLLKKKQYKQLLDRIKRDKKKLKSSPKQGEKYYKYLYQTENGLLQYYYKKELLLEKNNLSSLGDALDHYYLIAKLNLQLTTLSLFIKASEDHAEEAVSTLLAAPKFSGHVLIEIYKTTIALIQKKEEQSFFRLLELLDLHFSAIPEKLLNDLYLMAANFCITNIIRGKLEYRQYLFQLHKTQNKRNLILEDGVITLSKFKNIISLAAQMGAYTWAKAFIEKYRKAVPKDVRKSVCHFNYGVIAFYEKNYNSAIHHFIRVEKINPAYNINCRTMILKSHYQTDPDYDERTIQIFRSAVQFIKNQKTLAVNSRKGFKNFTIILINLYKFRHKAGKRSFQEIQNMLDRFEFISDKRWLLDRLEELG